MICDEIQANIELHATGDLAEVDPAADRAVADHLAGCPACRRLSTQTQGLFHRLDAALRRGPEALPAAGRNDLPARILAAVARDRSARRYRFGFLAAAACLLAALGVWRPWTGGGSHQPDIAQNQNQNQNQKPQPGELVACQVRQVKPSEFAVIGPRRVRLDRGTILVTVEPSSQPLVVQTPAGEATALGTEFTVAYEAVAGPQAGPAVYQMTVEVIHGTVQLANAQGSVTATAGQTLQARSNAQPVKRSAAPLPGPAAPIPPPPTQNPNPNPTSTSPQGSGQPQVNPSSSPVLKAVPGGPVPQPPLGAKNPGAAGGSPQQLVEE